jgi:hypothetical protein
LHGAANVWHVDPCVSRHGGEKYDATFHVKVCYNAGLL